MLLPCCAASRLSKEPTALSIDSSTRATLASWGNSTSQKFRGLEVLSPRDSLRSNTHKGSTRVTHKTLRNSASVEFQGKKCCLYKTPYIAAPIQVPRWHHCEFYALCATSYRCTYKSQKFFFWFTSDTFRKRPVLSYEDSYVNFYDKIYKQRWYRKQTTFCSSVSTSRLCSDSTSGAEASGSQKNKMTARKETLSNQPQLTCVTPVALLCSWVLQPIKVRHSSRLTSRSVPNGKGPLRNPCKGFCSEEGPHYRIE